MLIYIPNYQANGNSGRGKLQGMVQYKEERLRPRREPILLRVTPVRVIVSH